MMALPQTRAGLVRARLTLQSLPDELLSQAFSMLDRHDISAFRRVNKRLARIGENWFPDTIYLEPSVESIRNFHSLIEDEAMHVVRAAIKELHIVEALAQSWLPPAFEFLALELNNDAWTALNHDHGSRLIAWYLMQAWRQLEAVRQESSMLLHDPATLIKLNSCATSLPNVRLVSSSIYPCREPERCINVPLAVRQNYSRARDHWAEEIDDVQTWFARLAWKYLYTDFYLLKYSDTSIPPYTTWTAFPLSMGHRSDQIQWPPGEHKSPSLITDCTRLSLVLRTPDYCYTRYDTIYRQNLPTALTHAKSLRSLNIWIAEKASEIAYDIFEKLHLPQLKEISLNCTRNGSSLGQYGPEEHSSDASLLCLLPSFLKRHEATLSCAEVIMRIEPAEMLTCRNGVFPTSRYYPSTKQILELRQHIAANHTHCKVKLPIEVFNFVPRSAEEGREVDATVPSLRNETALVRLAEEMQLKEVTWELAARVPHDLMSFDNVFFDFAANLFPQ